LTQLGAHPQLHPPSHPPPGSVTRQACPTGCRTWQSACSVPCRGARHTAPTKAHAPKLWAPSAPKRQSARPRDHPARLARTAKVPTSTSHAPTCDRGKHEHACHRLSTQQALPGVGPQDAEGHSHHAGRHHCQQARLDHGLEGRFSHDGHAPARSSAAQSLGCNVMQCGAMRCGAMRCDAVRCGTMRYNAVQCTASQPVSCFSRGLEQPTHRNTQTQPHYGQTHPTHHAGRLTAPPPHLAPPTTPPAHPETRPPPTNTHRA
jgi:hypothetical protein